MSGDRVPGKVIFETQSTHKMLAAFFAGVSYSY